MKNKAKKRKLIVILFSAAIILLTILALVPLFISIIAGSGLKTEGLSADSARPASTELDGTWVVKRGDVKNFSSAGFTFDEVLPAEKTTTSGSTNVVSGQAKISANMLDEAEISVDMTTLTTDKQVRDHNMKAKLFETNKYPTATFTLTEPVDLSGVPGNGSVGSVTLTGDLTIKDKTKEVSGDFDVLRDGKKLIVAGDLPINRTDFDVITPDFLAAKIAEEGLINVRVTMSKK